MAGKEGTLKLDKVKQTPALRLTSTGAWTWRSNFTTDKSDGLGQFTDLYVSVFLAHEMLVL